MAAEPGSSFGGRLVQLAIITRRGELREWLRGSHAGLVPMALFVGAGAGLGAIVFRYLILWFTRIFSGRDDFSAAGRVAHPGLPWLGVFFVVLVPVVGGLLYGPLIHVFAREARGHGVPEVMLAVAEKGGRIRPQVAVVKSLASALCIGAGGSVGREGPIVQIGSALGSAVGQWLRVPESKLRVLVACGAAAGISATFNAPIAGVFFALELILQDFAANSFAVVVLSSVTAAVIGRAAFGSQPFLSLPPFHLVSYGEYGLYAGLGILGAVVGIAFIRVLYGTEDLVDRLWRGPEWLRPGVGGLALGLLLLALPQMYGVGYPVLQDGIRGQYVLAFVLLLLMGKVAATSLTIAIGGSGGVFAPSLFIGAMLGSGYGEVLQQLMPGRTAGPGAYGLVGMGAVFAAAARAPITAVIIIFELTGDYAIILPLMLAIVLSSGLSSLMSRDTIYTLKLRRRGIDIARGRSANLMQVLSVAEAMQPVPSPVPAEMPLRELIDRMVGERAAALPVLTESGGLRGVVTLAEVEAAMRDNALDMRAEDLAQESAAVYPEQSLEAALGRLALADGSGIPVVARGDDRTPIGWLTHRDVLQAYSHRLQVAVTEVTRQAGALDTGPPAGLRDYRVVDLELTTDAPPVGRLVRDINWPPASLLLAVGRGQQTAVVNGSTRLLRGDRLTVLVPAQHADHLDETIASEPVPR
ncbi:MAG: chloride channel protein [Candidatus Dormibacteria bacterium]